MRLKSLLGDSALYGGAAVASKAMGLATFPLLLSELDVSEYGTLDLFSYFLSLGAVVAAFGLDSALGRLLHDYEPKDRHRFVSTVLFLQAAILCIVTPLMALCAWIWLSAGASSNGYAYLSVIMVLQLPFSVAYSLAVGLSQWTFARKQYLFLTLGFTFLQAVVLVSGITAFDLSVVEIAAMTAVVTILFGCAGLSYLSSMIVYKIDTGAIRSVLRFAWPFGVIGLLGAFGPVAERSIVLSQLGAEELGLYSVAGKIASLMALVSIAFQTAWGPFAVAVHTQREGSRDLFAVVLWLVTTGMSVGAFALAALAQPLLSLFSAKDYFTAVPLVLPLALAAGVSATAAVMQVELLISKKSHLNLIAEIAFFVSLVGIAGVGASYLGSTAVAAATLISSLLRCYLLFTFAEGVLAGRASTFGVWSFIVLTSLLGIVLSGSIESLGAVGFAVVCSGTASFALATCLFILSSLRKGRSWL